MEQPDMQPKSKKEHTQIPDKTFPINIFHLSGTHSRIIPLHWHDHLEWIAITKGAFRVQIGDLFQDLHAGDAAFINKKQIHSAFPITEDSELYAVVFNEALLRNSALDCTETKYITPLLSHDIQLPAFYDAMEHATGLIHECIGRMTSSYRKKHSGYELLVKSSLLAALGYAFQLAEETAPANKGSRRESVIQPLLMHLSNHFEEPLSVEQAAQLCCISSNYFCYVFKKATGKTLIEYVNMLRVHEAEQLLRTQSYTIQQVALMVGYSNPTYFGRVFKKFKNTTPGEYMKRLSAVQ
jgi:AraC family transcriptional regulator, transcriptional activator of pobA